MTPLNCDISIEPSCQEINDPSILEIDRGIAELQQSQELLYQTINLEIWALVETMDRFTPGFWSRFLENRRISLKEFMKKKRGHRDME
ncbi:MAG TPA: hypothetical protein DEG17_00720 [Cyanobacteria bacterium UBA11149]|nr:hypothetical protein [Cyanobacteria bacterium UBA11367]HBE58717.1 hypothetical protein [Cyanobacteria bacterium UBA11366]HBK62871.1 hypothetical protein [Cyanobacteria bacterium UBA11166]HBR76745.1 hypothetical protein [Cyanobacteria bacterium UBA11159]HBS68539.1 hypothetical protein [Cyanobacteria bacterium UBA11153]HBW87436.1 hypothetical protein [Cyanobacteria bacterium UBA11149]HCA93514.1 hypothetical protein [Cyanobacteria bacterium UBA9226]